MGKIKNTAMEGTGNTQVASVEVENGTSTTPGTGGLPLMQVRNLISLHKTSMSNITFKFMTFCYMSRIIIPHTFLFFHFPP